MGLFQKRKTTTLSMICDGEVKDICEAEDEVFSQKMMGDGVMIYPTDGKIVSPCDAMVTMVFPSKHAMGLQLKDGTEILLHYGIDTVSLNGEGFQVFVKQGDQVTTGDTLWEADLDFIKTHAVSEAMMMVVTALPNKQTIEKQFGYKKMGETLLELK